MLAGQALKWPNRKMLNFQLYSQREESNWISVPGIIFTGCRVCDNRRKVRVVGPKFRDQQAVHDRVVSTPFQIE